MYSTKKKGVVWCCIFFSINLIPHALQIRQRANTLVERRRSASAVDGINNPISKARAGTWAGSSDGPSGEGDGGGDGGVADGAEVEEHRMSGGGEDDPWNETGRRFR